MRRFARCSVMFAAAIWLLVAAATLLEALSIAHVGSVNAPVLEEWLNADPAYYLPRLFEKYNSHPMVVERLALALDYRLFDAQGWALRYGALAALFLSALAIGWLGRLSGSRTPAAIVATTAVATVVLLNPEGADNYTWGFQFCFVTAFAFTVGAIVCLAQYATQPRIPWLIASVILGLGAALSLGNGVLTPFLLALMAWRLGASRRVVAAFGALALICALLLALMPTSTPAVIVFDVWRVLTFGFCLLGSSPAATFADAAKFGGLHMDPVVLALILGVALALAAGTLSMQAIAEMPPNPGKIGAVALISFSLASAGLASVGRSYAVLAYALSSRYTIVSAVLLAGTAVLVSSSVKSTSWKLNALALILAAPCTLVVPIAGLAQEQSFTVLGRQLARAQAAIVAGVETQTGLGRLGTVLYPFVTVKQVAPLIAKLRTERKWMFAERWAQRVGERIAIPASKLDTCGDGGILDAATSAQGFVEWRGHVNAGEMNRAEAIVILDKAGVMRGYGALPRRPIETMLFNRHQNVEWQGYSTAAPGDTYSAYPASSGGILCRLGSVALSSVTPGTSSRRVEQRVD